jgi:hypothetical protein
MREEFVQRQLSATVEVILVAAAYTLISTTAVRELSVAFLFPAQWSAAERATGSGFLIGAAVQVALVLIGAYLLRGPDLRRALAASLPASTRKAWIIAGTATAIHIATALLLFLPQPVRVWEVSELKAVRRQESEVDV